MMDFGWRGRGRIARVRTGSPLATVRSDTLLVALFRDGARVVGRGVAADCDAETTDALLARASAHGAGAGALALASAGRRNAEGLAAVRRAGGVVMATPEAAAAARLGRPGAAGPPLTPLDYDLVVEPARARAALADHAARAERLRRAFAAAPGAMREAAARLRAATARDFGRLAPGTLALRLGRRAALAQADRPEDYLAALRADPAERRLLARELGDATAPVDQDAVGAALDMTVSALGPGETATIWIAGCGTGLAAWRTAAAALARVRPAALAPGLDPALAFLATDADAEAIEVARRGVYPRSAQPRLGTVSAIGALESGAGQAVQIAAPLWESVAFAVHDILLDAPLVEADLLILDGALGLLDDGLTLLAAERLAAAVGPGGLLCSPFEPPGADAWRRVGAGLWRRAAGPGALTRRQRASPE